MLLLTPIVVACAVAANAGPGSPSQFSEQAGAAGPVAAPPSQPGGALLFSPSPSVGGPGAPGPDAGLSQQAVSASRASGAWGQPGAGVALRLSGTIPSRAVFDDTYPFSSLETFEAYSGSGFQYLDRDTIDSTTDNDFFNAGDIDPGLRITVASGTPGSNPANFLMADENNGNYTSAAVTYGNAEGPPDIVIDFLIPSTAVAMDITGNPDGTGAVVEVFSGPWSLGSFPVNGTGAGTFFGFESFERPVTRVEIDGGSFNGVDNIAYSRLCENFEDANVAFAGFANVAGSVIDSFTNDDVLSPGDIAQSLRIVPTEPGNMYMAAAGFDNYVTDTVTYGNNNAGGHELEVLFPNGTGLFSFDLTGNPDGSVATVSVYSGPTLVASAPIGGAGAGSLVLAPFALTPITRMTIDNNGAGGFNGVDNFCFDPCESLEEANLAPGGSAALPDAIDAGTNTAAFAAGSIAEGLTIRALVPGQLFVVAADFANYTSDTITYGGNQAGPELAVDFHAGASMVSMEITGNPDGSLANVEVFSGAVSLGVFAVTGTGIGTPFTHSSAQQITSVTIDNAGLGGFNGVDNICFVARLIPCDLDGNGMYNVDDVDLFVSGFLGNNGNGDCDGNGVWNVDDIDCFVACFLAGN